MPKKQKPNGFLLFMMDYRRREERKGRIFKGGIQEVQADPECNKEWQARTFFNFVIFHPAEEIH